MTSAWKQSISSLAGRAIDIVLPPRCLISGEPVEAPGLLAPEFWSKLNFIEAPYCNRCGMPFAFSPTGGNITFLCGACLDHPPAFDMARQALVYDDTSRDMILKFKYADKLHFSKTFALWLKRAAADLLPTTDIIAPVPLHRFKLWRRRYNQASLLATALARQTHILCLPDLLERNRATKPHRGMTIKDRKNNVRDAFAVRERHAASLKGKNVLIVDDVHTTGATLNECARALFHGGANKIYALSLARVTRDSV